MGTVTSRRRRYRERRLVSRIPGDPLVLLGVAPSAARILRYFALRPSARPRAHYLQRVLGLGGASLQRELKRLVALGALDRVEDGRRVRYSVASGTPLWTAFRLLLGAASDPTELIRDALCDVAGVQAAFIFGSTVTATDRDDSDVDVFVIEESTVDRRALLRQFAEAGMLLGREVNPVRYTPQTLAERLGNPDHAASHFVRKVLAGPKCWVAGTAASILPLATAAGLRERDIA